jgi:hypothetical protein
VADGGRSSLIIPEARIFATRRTGNVTKPHGSIAGNQPKLARVCVELIGHLSYESEECRTMMALPGAAELANRRSQRLVFTPLHSAQASRPDDGDAAALPTHAGALPPASVSISSCWTCCRRWGASPLPTVIDKTRYSAFAEPTLIVSTPGADVCVLTTVRDAVDVGYRVMSCATRYGARSDEGHDMLMRLYHTRYTENTETADATTFCADAMLLNRCILSSRLMRSRTAREPTCSM